MICDQATVVLTVLPVTDTLCTNELPLPQIAADKRVCMGDTIHLFTTTPYPSVVLEVEDTSYQFLWFNANGDTLAITRESEVGIFSKDSLAIPPFSMKAIQGACASGFSNLLNIEIVDIIAANFLETEETVICQQESVKLSAVQQTDIVYQWTIQNVEGILSLIHI